MNECGFGVFSFDAEGGDGQAEFDFEYAPALQMADRLVLFRLMAKQVAKKAGLEATFMPKPYTEAWGSGAHFNMSLADPETGRNLFRDASDRRSAGGARWPTVSSPGSSPRPRPRRDLHAYGQLVQAADGHGCRTDCVVGAGLGGVWRQQPVLHAPPAPQPPLCREPGRRLGRQPLPGGGLLLAAGLEGVTEGLDPGEPVEDLIYDWADAGRRAVT